MEDLLIKAVERMRDRGAKFCDARMQSVKSMQIQVVDGAVRSLNTTRSGGVCFRSRSNGAWGYASCPSMDEAEVLAAAEAAVHNAQGGTAKGKEELKGIITIGRVRAEVGKHPDDVPLKAKLALALDLDRAQRVDRKIVNTNALYLESVKNNEVVNSLGTSVEWEEVRGRLMAQAIASDAGRTEIFYDITDGTKGFDMFEAIDVEEIGRTTATEAVKMLKAKKCPSGLLPCITDSAITGLLAHEVMGHASEADEVVKKRSFLTPMMGKKVANPQITMLDDGTYEGAHGRIPFDDEGTPSSRTVIIDEGVYKGYMHSLETSTEMGVRPTGNGRAESTSRRVFVRMTNTFFAPGDWRLDEMIEDVKYGVLTDKAISGMEDPVGGGFEAKALRGYMIENGRVTDMLRGFSLTGKALDILKTTDAVGNRLELDGGTCGKGIEDFVPVSSGGPYCRSKIILGGG
ncbi:MAG: TldD/PmbA family protein [Methanomassiliicoccales archaeon]|jgi:TldD protein